VSAATPPSEPSTIVVVLDGVLDSGDATALSERLQASVEGAGARLIVCDVGGLVDPSGVAVDVLARLQLTARRLGCRLCLRDASLELRDLIAFTGLEDVLPLDAALRVESGRQTEEGEEARGVEEERDPADPGARRLDDL
jgi:anti-anti-sigma factor